MVSVWFHYLLKAARSAQFTMANNCYISAFRWKTLQFLCVSFLVVSMCLVILVHQQSVENIYRALRGPLEELQSSSNPVVNKRFFKTNRTYNLMEEPDSKAFYNYDSKDCTLDYLNTKKLPQDHPCVIETIRQHYLNKPSPPEVPLKLDSNDDHDRSPGQTKVILRLLKNQTKGFFAECGALDGEFYSNTVDLERRSNWTGVLIEANPHVFEKLMSRNRKSWTLPVCLSLEPYPTQVKFQPKEKPGLSHIQDEKTLMKPGVPGVDPESVTVQCFPFYSILLAIGRTQIDYFSLDVEGHELKILKTIPWHKVDIKSMTVEWENIVEGEDALSKFMEQSGFIRVGTFDVQWSKDVIFIKDLINDV